jgi:hypothetical protein
MTNSLKIFFFVSVLLAFASNTGVSAQCVSVKTMANLNLTRAASGRWYGIKGGKNLSFAQSWCVRTDFTATTLTPVINVPLSPMTYTNKSNVLSFNQFVAIANQQLVLDVS